MPGLRSMAALLGGGARRGKAHAPPSIFFRCLEV
jgi:hypothetical protein